MISCRKASELISLSLDRPLALRERLTLGLHLCGCSMCRAYRRQAMFIRNVAQAMLARMRRLAPGEMELSPSAVTRITRALDAEDGGSGP
ncbi:MAG: zf-HC2 domain-containing protein [Gammaproteobacteria bacterium]|nr:zf-HC2 domain-containing protein [Gammaproteobacteria bacterium]